MDYGGIVPYVVGSIQEQDKQLSMHDARLSHVNNSLSEIQASTVEIGTEINRLVR